MFLSRFTHYASSITDIYSYLLTYKSKNSFADLVLGVDSETYGLKVCHADDLYHIFKVPETLTTYIFYVNI